MPRRTQKDEDIDAYIERRNREEYREYRQKLEQLYGPLINNPYKALLEKKDNAYLSKIIKRI